MRLAIEFEGHSRDTAFHRSNVAQVPQGNNKPLELPDQKGEIHAKRLTIFQGTHSVSPRKKIKGGRGSV